MIYAILIAILLTLFVLVRTLERMIGTLTAISLQLSYLQAQVKSFESVLRVDPDDNYFLATWNRVRKGAEGARDAAIRTPYP